ncbi:MAG TPA: DUF3592 domain-containing protein [Candidatus Limnocylindrales bacterium]|nr:DUF3592 domain-containing protein [Candidatus Limnocylindrales bacterium]
MVAELAPTDERVLWTGAPDPGLASRDPLIRAGGVLARLLVGAGFMVVMLVQTLGVDGLASAGPVLGMLVLGGLIVVGWTVLSAIGARRDVPATRWTLTDRHLVIEVGSDRTELRLANLPDLRMELERDGVGTISFDLPVGAGPERYLRRIAGPFLGGRADVALLRHVPDVQRVYQLIVGAQAGSGPAAAAGDEPRFVESAPPPAPPSEAPVARLSFLESAARVPLWFGSAFLVVGLVVIGWAILGMTAGGASITGGIPLLLLGAVFATLGGALAYGRLDVVRTGRRLSSHGLSVPGRVIDIAATGIRVGGAHATDDPMTEQWVVRYRYELNGRHFTGHTPPMSWAEAARYAAGDEVALLVDPDRPARSMLSDLP